jgi:hypothetical protein
LDQITSTLGFTLEDLVLNRAGKLSSHQVSESVKVALTFCGIAMMAVGAVLAVLFLVRPTGVLRVLYGTLSLGAAVLATAFAWREVAGAATRRVLTDEGSIDLHGTGRGMVAVVGRSRVGISTDALKVITKGDRYRIYYLARSDRFLSIEPIQEPAPSPAKPDLLEKQ